MIKKKYILMHLIFRQHRRRLKYEESKNPHNLSYLHPVHSNNKYNRVPKKHFKINKNLLCHVSALYDHQEQESASIENSLIEKENRKECKIHNYIYHPYQGQYSAPLINSIKNKGKTKHATNTHLVMTNKNSKSLKHFNKQ